MRIVRALVKTETSEPRLNEPLVPVDDAASSAGVSASVLTRAIQDGELASYRQVETRTLVYMSEVFAALTKIEQWGML